MQGAQLQGGAGSRRRKAPGHPASAAARPLQGESRQREGTGLGRLDPSVSGANGENTNIFCTSIKRSPSFLQVNELPLVGEESTNSSPAWLHRAVSALLNAQPSGCSQAPLPAPRTHGAHPFLRRSPKGMLPGACDGLGRWLEQGGRRQGSGSRASELRRAACSGSQRARPDPRARPRRAQHGSWTPEELTETAAFRVKLKGHGVRS